MEMRLVPARDELSLGRPGRLTPAQCAENAYECVPFRGNRWRDGEARERRDRIQARSHRVEESRRGRRADARNETRHAKSCHAAPRVLRPAQNAEHVLHVRSFEKTQTTIFDERYAAPRELDLELGAVIGAAEEDRLRLERDARLVVFEHALGDAARLIGFIADGNELRLLAHRSIAA